ncbi:protein of unknown function [Latilactobacillus sakei]|uniref:hypothetical protein n=1 Tax=Latilactobacillus sakei TaxID=1599 RepID=UPI000CA1FAF2|nr:hypothetical protein [Latilactobacillus sakei]SON66810.1 protein of unknown function [Latilactobacillus sakei]
MVNEEIAWDMYMISRNLNWLIDHCEDKKQLVVIMNQISKKVFEMVDSKITDKEGKADE